MIKFPLLLIGVAAAAFALKSRAGEAGFTSFFNTSAMPDFPATDGNGVIVDSNQSGADQSSTQADYANAPVDDSQAAQNVAAFLKVIRVGEGTSDSDGYRRMFGGRMFNSFADHPRMLQTATFANGKRVTSDAAGAYQFLSTTWDEMRRANPDIMDFSPAMQDLAAITLLQQRGIYDDIVYGNFDAAVNKAASTWASLPGSPYGQPTQPMDTLYAVYEQNNGGYA